MTSKLKYIAREMFAVLTPEQAKLVMQDIRENLDLSDIENDVLFNLQTICDSERLKRLIEMQR